MVEVLEGLDLEIAILQVFLDDVTALICAGGDGSEIDRLLDTKRGLSLHLMEREAARALKVNIEGLQ